MTSHFFSHNTAIDMYQISQGKIFSEKPGITPNCGIFPLSAPIFQHSAQRLEGHF